MLFTLFHNKNPITSETDCIKDIERFFKQSSHVIEKKVIDRFVINGQTHMFDRFSCPNLILRNEVTGQFVVFELYGRHKLYTPISVLDDPCCLLVFKTQFRKKKYGKRRVSPFVPRVTDTSQFENLLPTIFLREKIHRKLFFKGYGSRSRRRIINYLRAGVVSRKAIRKSNKRFIGKKRVTYAEYLVEMAESKLALALPGRGAFCFREIEAFGIGTPVLSPKFFNSYYDDLIPNYHYISVDHPQGSIASDGLDKYKVYDYACKIRKRYFEVINDDEQLSFIAANALRWFKENVTYPNNMLIMESILNVYDRSFLHIR